MTEADRYFEDSALKMLLSPDELREVSVELAETRSVRLKVTKVCSWTCGFCHEEGGWANLNTIKWDEATQAVFTKLYTQGYREVHFTGGEPTLNINLPEITTGLKAIGYRVKTTSVLGAKEKGLIRIADAGIDGINISLHGDFTEVDTDTKYVPDAVASEVADIQIGVNIARAKMQILRLVKGIEIMRERGIALKSNTVVSSEADIDRVLEIYKYAKSQGIMVRLLPDLTPSKRESAHAAIKSIVNAIGAKPIRLKVNKGTSNATLYFNDPNDGTEFGVKLILDYFLEGMCEKCPVASNADCTEKFYGIRLEEIAKRGEDSKYIVRLCLHRDDKEITMPLDEFLASPHFETIVKDSFTPEGVEFTNSEDLDIQHVA